MFLSFFNNSIKTSQNKNKRELSSKQSESFNGKPTWIFNHIFSSKISSLNDIHM